ncbi:hypothetical protein [Carboxylicivirga taeanensis]|uniref:hypothetical protein n=1 Tax=Carboxylicivirga taeanensis TaxID=1416875 RepID=UPI003F6DA71D
MKNTLYILTIVLIFGCQAKNSKTESLTYEINETKTATNENVVKSSIVTRTYLSDSTYLDYDFQTSLKNGFKLEYRVYKESNNPDTLQTIFLIKDTTDIMDLTGGSSYGLPHKNIGYIGADFDSSFVFVQSFGSGNPHEIQLIDKRTGKPLRKGAWVDANEENQILLYIENINESNERLKIFDIERNKETIVNDFQDCKCVQYAIGGLRDCVSIDTVTQQYIILISSYEDDKVEKKYNR